MKKIEAVIRPEMVDRVKDALADAGFSGLTTSQATGRGAQRGVAVAGMSGRPISIDMLPKVKLEIVVSDADLERAVDVILAHARTGEIGDGKVFILPVEQVVRVRTGERGDAAI